MQIALRKMGEKAVSASRALAVLSADAKSACIRRMADELEISAKEILKANDEDVKNAIVNGLSAAMVDRLTIGEKGIKNMAEGLRAVAAQSDPVGKTISSTIRPNGLKIDKVTVPIGVIAIIYEARPNVTSDAAGICLKAGNAVILRGGKEAFASNQAIAAALNRAAVLCGLPDGAVQLLPWTSHEAVNLMLKMDEYIDLIIPRGGERLIRTVMAESTIPVIKHYKGVCHLFVDRDCDFNMALDVVENAKCQRPGTCNALETLLIDRAIADTFVPMLVERMESRGVELRGGVDFCKMVPSAKEASDEDFYNEYLALKLSCRIVDDVYQAVEHINRYGSKHSDGILTNDTAKAEFFIANVDTSTVYHNASTRFTDGGEFGLGAEIGISTDKLHARGPMGANELVSTKFIVHGSGQTR
ncbi:MAG: glutamate-5-semialdehyde dehydrogenase [Lentisphaeria bacterium]|nr:glutamate-5-semialdehyde dehydrogenase [Lentisphaeria bacterium]